MKLGRRLRIIEQLDANAWSMVYETIRDDTRSLITNEVYTSVMKPIWGKLWQTTNFEIMVMGVR